MTDVLRRQEFAIVLADVEALIDMIDNLALAISPATYTALSSIRQPLGCDTAAGNSSTLTHPTERGALTSEAAKMHSSEGRRGRQLC